MPVFQAIAKDKATTMGHIQRGHLESTIVQIPQRPAIDDLDRILQPLWDRLLQAERETLHLTALRDTLLPELLAGRIQVLARERLVEAGT
jgi:type I restriction enzyme, S subunit